MKSDAWLVSRVVLFGDRNAFGQLVERYQSSVRRLLQNLTGDEEAAKDLAQEAFVKAWVKIGSFRFTARFPTWIYRIAYNTWYDQWRREKAAGRMQDQVRYETVPEPASGDFGVDFEKALRVLSEAERAVMLLFFMEDQTVEQIAKITDYPAGTVKSHLSRGKKKLEVFFKHTPYDRR